MVDILIGLIQIGDRIRINTDAKIIRTARVVEISDLGITLEVKGISHRRFSRDLFELVDLENKLIVRWNRGEIVKLI